MNSWEQGDDEDAGAERRVGERRQPPLTGDLPQRRRADRRQAQRRQVDLGPPPGCDERRRSPDLRGVVFPLFYPLR